MELKESVRPKFVEPNMDFEVRSLDTASMNESELVHPWWHNVKYLVAGIFFGIILMKAEIISWFRIQEMFRLESFHMYGVIGSAVVVALLANQLIKRFGVKTVYGEQIAHRSKRFNKG